MAHLFNAERKRRYRAKSSEERREEVIQQDRERKRKKKEKTVESKKEKGKYFTEKNKRFWKLSLDNLPLKPGKQKEKLFKNFTKHFQIHQPRG